MQAFEDSDGIRVYRPAFLQVLKGALRAASQSELKFKEAVVRARERIRHLGRPVARRAVGSTLLLGGLEANVAVVLNPAAMDARHLYVALTIGAKRLVVCSATPTLAPE